MTNQIFKNQRFANYLKKYIYERRTSLLVTVSLYLVFEVAFCTIMPFLLGAYQGKADYYSVNIDPMWSAECKFFFIFLIAAAVGCGGSFYEILRKKNDRVTTFTCPASSFEKFVTYFSIYVLFLVAVSIGGMFFADAVKVWIYTNPEHTLQPAYIPASYLFTLGKGYYLSQPGFTPEEYEMIKENVLINGSLFYSLFIICFAFFSLGGTIWDKKNVTKTLFAAWIVIGICITLFYFGSELVFHSGTLVINNFLNLSKSTMAFCIFGFSTIWAIFLWWISYVRFKEWEVIRRW